MTDLNVNCRGVIGAKAAPKTFLLIHGSFCGGCYWRRVSDLLKKKRHKVFLPTRAGLGEHSHLLEKDIRFDTHITDIVNLIKWEDLNGIFLVAHSVAGWSGSGALKQIGDRLSSIVWVDAFTPADGEKAVDVVNEVVRKTALSAADKGEPGLPAAPAALFLVNEKDRAYVDSKLTPQPVGTYLQPINVSGRVTGWRRRPISEPRDIGCRRSIRRLPSARPIHSGARSKTTAPATLS